MGATTSKIAPAPSTNALEDKKDELLRLLSKTNAELATVTAELKRCDRVDALLEKPDVTTRSQDNPQDSARQEAPDALLSWKVQDTWTAAAWLSSPSLDVAKHVAEVLLSGPRPADELAAMRALGAASTSEAALAERLRAGGLAELLAKAVLPELQSLVAAVEVTGVELHGKVIAAISESPAVHLHARRPPLRPIWSKVCV